MCTNSLTTGPLLIYFHSSLLSNYFGGHSIKEDTQRDVSRVRKMPHRSSWSLLKAKKTQEEEWLVYAPKRKRKLINTPFVCQVKPYRRQNLDESTFKASRNVG